MKKLKYLGLDVELQDKETIIYEGIVDDLKDYFSSLPEYLRSRLNYEHLAPTTGGLCITFDEGVRIEHRIVITQWSVDNGNEYATGGHEETHFLYRTNRLKGLVNHLEKRGIEAKGLESLDEETICDIGGFVAVAQTYAQFNFPDTPWHKEAIRFVTSNATDRTEFSRKMQRIRLCDKLESQVRY